MFDHHVLWRQISLNVKLALAITPKDTYRSDSALHMFIGNRNDLRKLIVRYQEGSDTYAIEIGRVIHHTDWQTEAQADGVTVDQLSTVLLHLYDQVTGPLSGAES